MNSSSASARRWRRVPWRLASRSYTVPSRGATVPTGPGDGPRRLRSRGWRRYRPCRAARAGRIRAWFCPVTPSFRSLSPRCVRSSRTESFASRSWTEAASRRCSRSQRANSRTTGSTGACSAWRRYRRRWRGSSCHPRASRLFGPPNASARRWTPWTAGTTTRAATPHCSSPCHSRSPRYWTPSTRAVA